MKRYPDGWQGKFFFQKTRRCTCPTGSRITAHLSRRGETAEKKWVSFPLVNDELALLWTVNMAAST